MIHSRLLLWEWGLEGDHAQGVTQVGIEIGQAKEFVHVTAAGIEVGHRKEFTMVTIVGAEVGQAVERTLITQVGLEIGQIFEEPLFPEEGEDLCEIVDDPIAFTSWQPHGSGTTRIWAAEATLDDPNTYYGGFKTDRLLNISEIRRALSSTNWEYEVSNYRVTWADDDYAIRAVLAESPGMYYSTRELEAYFVTPDGRHAFVTPKKIASGFVDGDPSFDDEQEAMSVTMPCRDRIGVAMGWTADGQADLPRRTLIDETLPGVVLVAYGKAAPYPYGTLTAPSGAVRAWYTRSVELPDLQTWHEFIIAGCAIKAVDDWAYVTASGTMELNSGDGTEWIVPGSAGWTSVMGTSDPYVDVIGGDTITRRYTFAYGIGPKADLVASGTDTFRVNIRGVERNGDGSGSLIDDLHDITTHIIENHCFGVNDGYRTGAWAPKSTFGFDGIYQIDYTEFAALKTMRSDELESSGWFDGLLGAGILGAFGEQVPVSEVLRRLQASGDFRLGANRFWQISPAAIDENLTPDMCAPLVDVYDIHMRTFKPAPRITELYNEIPYRYNRDYVNDGNWYNDNLRTLNETSVANWRTTRKSPVVEYYWQVDETINNHIRSKIYRRKSDAPMYITLEGNLCLLSRDYDIGKYVTLDHWRGIQVSGWLGRPLWIVSSTLLPDNRRVRLELLDIYNLVTGF